MIRGAFAFMLVALATSTAVAQDTAESASADTGEAAATADDGDEPSPDETPAGPAGSEPPSTADTSDAPPEGADEAGADAPSQDTSAPPPAAPLREQDTEENAPEEQPTVRARSADAEAYSATESGSLAASVLGTATVVFGVVTAGTLGYFLDRTGQVDTCAAAEAFEESERGCVNRPLLESQRDTGLGVFLGALGGFAILATSWAIVAATDSGDDAEQARVRCAPGLAAISCAGRF